MHRDLYRVLFLKIGESLNISEGTVKIHLSHLFEKLGATIDKKMERWVVMRAPTGQRFCIVRVQRMKIGKTTIPASAICTANRDTIVVRGHDLCRELIGSISFGG